MWETIKKILSKEGGKCIIVEKGKPSYIVTKIDDYESDPVPESLEIEKINKDIAEWKAKEKEQEAEIMEIDEQNDVEKQEVKVEDLPF